MSNDPTTGTPRRFEASEDDPNAVRILPESSYLPDETPARRYQPYEPYEPAQESQPVKPPPPYSDRPLQAEQPSLPTAAATPAEPPARRSSSACTIIAVTFAILALSCALLGFATIQGGLEGLGKLAGSFPSFGLVTTPTVTIDTSRPTIIDKVTAMGRLETVHYQLEKVISAKSTGPLPDFLTSDRILLVAHGEVIAGIDLTKLDESDIQVDGENVTIWLPEPEILVARLDNNKTYVYDRETGIFSRPDPNLETQVRQAAEQQILQAALEDGILERARTNAEEVIRTLVTGLGYKDVEFR
jgi:Protein of unknown function (DUF4230)